MLWWWLDLWDTILEIFQQAQQQSRAGFLKIGLQPEIRGDKITVNEGGAPKTLEFGIFA